MADRRLQVFHAVAKYLSFTKAADALFMSQPSVTLQVKNLEEEHGTRLIERRHGAISLTPAGELLRTYAEKILFLSDEVETRLSEMTGEMRGLFQIGASSSLAEWLLPQLLAEFNALYPQVRTRLFVANSEIIESRVAEHSLELGFIDTSLSSSAGLDYEMLGEDELQVICAPDYPLAGQKSVKPASLIEYEYIAREPGSGTRAASDRYLLKHKIDPSNLKMQMELGSSGPLKAVVATGLGFAIFSRALVEKEIERKTLLAIPLKPALKNKFQLIYPQGRFRSRMTTTFIDFAKGKLREMA